MFSPGRVLAFLKKFLRLALITILSLLLLSILTEVLTHLDELPIIWRGPTFWISIVINMLPIVIISAVVFWLAGRFVRDFYKLDSTKSGVDFLLRSRFGQHSFRPWMRVEQGAITFPEDSALKRTGGPGNLVVYSDSAIVLEHSGKLTRVEGPGFPKLEPFEYIYDIIDLRPKRWVFKVNAMTKDGIPISWDAEVHYQIADGGQEPNEETPYPVSKDDILKASSSKWNFVGRTVKLDWEARIIIGNTEGGLRSILARKWLNQLIGITEKDAQAARREVQQELEQALRDSAPEIGAKVLDVKLANLTVEDQITQQWIDLWRTRWQRWTVERLAHGEAAQIYLHETAKAEAQMSLLVSIGRALQSLTDRDMVIPHIVLIRLFSVLDRAAFDASSRIFFPTEALDVLDRMRTLIEKENIQIPQLLPGDGE
jgi:regulator of protease activity HflC (stomatin/prohibitin superfamily)